MMRETADVLDSAALFHREEVLSEMKPTVITN
jgi:hypothetical protein